MRLRIDTSEIKFRVAALAKPRARSRTDQTQKTTPDGRPIWAVRLTAIDTGSNSVETIWVEVAGEEPKLTLDELALVQGLVVRPVGEQEGRDRPQLPRRLHNRPGRRPQDPGRVTARSRAPTRTDGSRSCRHRHRRAPHPSSSRDQPDRRHIMTTTTTAASNGSTDTTTAEATGKPEKPFGMARGPRGRDLPRRQRPARRRIRGQPAVHGDPARHLRRLLPRRPQGPRPRTPA